MIKFQMIFDQSNENSISFCLMIRRSNRKKMYFSHLSCSSTKLLCHFTHFRRKDKRKEKKRNTLGLQLSFTKDSGTQIVICKEWCEVANMAIAWVTQKFKTPCLRGFSVMDSHVEWQINNGEKNSRRRHRRLI